MRRYVALTLISGLEKIELPFAIERLQNGVKSRKEKNTFTVRMKAGVDTLIEVNSGNM